MDWLPLPLMGSSVSNGQVVGMGAVRNKYCRAEDSCLRVWIGSATGTGAQPLSRPRHTLHQWI